MILASGPKLWQLQKMKPEKIQPSTGFEFFLPDDIWAHIFVCVMFVFPYKLYLI